MSAIGGISFITLIKGFFAVVDLAKRFLVFVQLRQAKQTGRTERDLEVQKETTEVLARNNEAGNMVDQLSDQQVDEEFKKL